MKPCLNEFLSPRQAEIAYLMAYGLSDKEIGVELSIGMQTVKKHEKKLRDRLGVRSRVSVVVYVLTGWLPSGACCPTPLSDYMRAEYSTRNKAA